MRKNKDHDERFDQVKKDPRFQHPKKKITKVIIDDRFKSMFTDEDFSGSADKYGRQNVVTMKENLSHLYKLENKDSYPLPYDPMRGEGVSESSTDEDIDEPIDETQQEELQQLHPHHQAANAPLGQPSHRLALLNLDWDQINVQDIFQLLYSFKPQLGSIVSVKKYTSMFGKERLEREKLQGPPSDIFSPVEQSNEVVTLEEQNEGEEFIDHELRKYQLERLKYYYVIIETDSIETACHIYKECDGREFEKSCNILDIRYVPDNETFDENDVVEQVSQPATKYQPHITATRALQHSRVELTWDGDDPKRSRITRTRHEDLELSDEDFAAYLASSASEDEVKPEDDISIYRNLLQNQSENVFQGKERNTSNDIEGNENMELQMTFHTALDVKKLDQITDNDKKKKISRKEKERLALLVEDESQVDGRNHFNMREIIKAEKKGKSSDSFNIEVEDPRFSAVFDSAQYAIDPTNPHFKKTKNMMKILEAKRKKTAKEILHE